MSERFFLYAAFAGFAALAVFALFTLASSALFPDDTVTIDVAVTATAAPDSTLPTQTTQPPLTTTTSTVTPTTTDPYPLTVIEAIPPTEYPLTLTINGTATPSMVVTASYDTEGAQALVAPSAEFSVLLPLDTAPSGEFLIHIVESHPDDPDLVVDSVVFTYVNDFPVLQVDPTPEVVTSPVVPVMGITTPNTEVYIDSYYGFASTVSLPNGRFAADLVLEEIAPGTQLTVAVSTDDAHEKFVVVYDPGEG